MAMLALGWLGERKELGAPSLAALAHMPAWEVNGQGQLPLSAPDRRRQRDAEQRLGCSTKATTATRKAGRDGRRSTKMAGTRRI